MMVLLPLGAAITEGEHHVTIGLVRVPVDTHTQPTVISVPPVIIYITPIIKRCIAQRHLFPVIMDLQR